MSEKRINVNAEKLDAAIEMLFEMHNDLRELVAEVIKTKMCRPALRAKAELLVEKYEWEPLEGE